MSKEWVIDVTIDPAAADPPLFCFCPYERDTESVVTGMNLLTAWPEEHLGKVIGIVHMDGEEAVEKWIRDNPDRYRVMLDRQIAPQSRGNRR